MTTTTKTTETTKCVDLISLCVNATHLHLYESLKYLDMSNKLTACS